MDNDVITEIGIDDKGRYLFAPPPPRARLATPIWWFQRILGAAKSRRGEGADSPDG